MQIYYLLFLKMLRYVYAIKCLIGKIFIFHLEPYHMRDSSFMSMITVIITYIVRVLFSI